MVTASKNRESLILTRRCQAEGKEISSSSSDRVTSKHKAANKLLVNGLGPVKKYIGPASLEGGQMSVLVVVTY